MQKEAFGIESGRGGLEWGMDIHEKFLFVSFFSFPPLSCG